MITEKNAPMRVCLGRGNDVMIAAVEKTIVGDVVAIDEFYFTVRVPRALVTPADVVLERGE